MTPRTRRMPPSPAWWRRGVSFLFAALLAWTAAPPAAGQSPAAYKVIVNPQNPATQVERRFLLEAFLKKTTHWRHGEPIRPVDLAADSPARRRFSEDALNRSVAAVKSYWQQSI